MLVIVVFGDNQQFATYVNRYKPSFSDTNPSHDDRFDLGV